MLLQKKVNKKTYLIGIHAVACHTYYTSFLGQCILVKWNWAKGTSSRPGNPICSLQKGRCPPPPHGPLPQPSNNPQVTGYTTRKKAACWGVLFFPIYPGFGFSKQLLSWTWSFKKISVNSVKLAGSIWKHFCSLSESSHWTRVKRWHSQTNKKCRIHSTPGWNLRESFPTWKFPCFFMAIFPYINYSFWEGHPRSENVRPDSARYVNLKAWPIHCEPTIPARIPTPFMPPLPPEEGTKTQHPTEINVEFQC